MLRKKMGFLGGLVVAVAILVSPLVRAEGPQPGKEGTVSKEAKAERKKQHQVNRQARQEYRKMLRDNKILEADKMAVEKKKKEIKDFQMAVKKDGTVSEEEKQAMKTHRQELDSLMEKAVQNAKTKT